MGTKTSTRAKPHAKWLTGEPADLTDTTIKYAVQRTGHDAVVFRRKGEAQKHAQAVANMLRQEGWTVRRVEDWNGRTDFRSFYRNGSQPFGVWITSRG